MLCVVFTILQAIVIVVVCQFVDWLRKHLFICIQLPSEQPKILVLITQIMLSNKNTSYLIVS